jgi:hypothetical protein
VTSTGSPAASLATLRELEVSAERFGQLDVLHAEALGFEEVMMQVFVREHCTMIAAPDQCDVDGIPKGSHCANVLPIKVRWLDWKARRRDSWNGFANHGTSLRHHRGVAARTAG